MALIKCEECKKTFSDTLDACPHCGFKKEEEIKLFMYSNLTDSAYEYAQDTGLLDFPRYKVDQYSTKEKYSDFINNMGNSLFSTIMLVINTMKEKQEYDYSGMNLLIPFIDQYYQGQFCLGVCDDRILYFSTKKAGIKIVEMMRSTLDVSCKRYSNINLAVFPDKNGNMISGIFQIDEKNVYTVSGYEPVMLWYLSYCIEKINNKDYDLNYKKGTIKKKKFTSEQISNASSGGCYVATCVYGSYDCPQVWTLRRYRDYFLAKRWYGRIFIHLYYAISPSIVKLFGKTKWFNMIGKRKLDQLVEKLQNEGYENTIYEDIQWK